MIRIVPEAGVELPPAPSGQPPKRRIEGSIALPQPLAEEVQRHAEEQDKNLTITDNIDSTGQRRPSPNAGRSDHFSILWGGGSFFRR